LFIFYTIKTIALCRVFLRAVGAVTDYAVNGAVFYGKHLAEDIVPDLWVQGDGTRLRQLVSVLLDNAIKYSPDGSTISLTLQKIDRQARLTVSNPGEPIPPDKLSHLFERFYRADASRGEQTGFGLGLSIAAAIAKEHKAALKAESDSNSTRFTLTIPLKK